MDKAVADSLTNEQLTKRFKNQFELVNYAIQLAGNLIFTGRAPRVDVDVQNPAVQAVREIEEGEDVLEPIVNRKESSDSSSNEFTQEFSKSKIVFSEESLEGEMLRVTSPKKGRNILED